MLLPGYEEPPLGLAELRRPADPARRFTRLDDWLAAVRERWEPGCRFALTTVELATELLEDELLAEVEAGGSDARVVGAAGIVDVHLDRTTGALLTVDFGHPGRRRDYCVLAPDHRPAPEAALDVEELAGGRPASLAEFLAGERAAWRPGSTFAVLDTRCGTAPPGPTPLRDRGADVPGSTAR